ncbi:MAG TPA: flagellar basal body L-ring protein FlgH [Caulobacteraceae bacterium]|jgi:flagellar L-ring protein precursor FlgH|nr:flagellar basal body L-ring protein FlgH [Caulobacteraceae bacterium]
MRSAVVISLALAAAAPLCACSSIKEAVNGPQMAPMGYPSALIPTGQQVLPIGASGREPLPQPASANSLWRVGARAFFNDQRASRVGDILTVLININDTAKTSNATNASRTGTSTAGITNFFGLESTLGRILPKSFSPANALNTSSALASSGTGGVTRQEQIQLTVAAVVSQVLPNGNLVIQGRQEVETNNDVRELTVSGIVRPEDISSTNTILHTQIAEARIKYGGRGDISTVQKTPAGTALMQKFYPF